jgi:hypothetical protein
MSRQELVKKKQAFPEPAKSGEDLFKPYPSCPCWSPRPGPLCQLGPAHFLLVGAGEECRDPAPQIVTRPAEGDQTFLVGALDGSRVRQAPVETARLPQEERTFFLRAKGDDRVHLAGLGFIDVLR